MLSWPALNRPFVFGHRGASAHAPENTLEAFELAIEEGADGIEFDVKLSQDHIVVIIHDPTLERTTGGQGRVNKHSLAEMQTLNASEHFQPPYAVTHIPTLEQVFERLGGRVLMNIELTNYTSPFDSLVPRVVKLVKQFGLEDSVLFSSFLPHDLWLAKTVLPQVYRGMLANPGNEGKIIREKLWHWGCQALHPHEQDVTPQLVDAVHRRGGRVHVYTVNDPDVMRRFADWGVDAIFTDNPALARQVFAERE